MIAIAPGAPITVLASGGIAVLAARQAIRPGEAPAAGDASGIMPHGAGDSGGLATGFGSDAASGDGDCGDGEDGGGGGD